MVGIGLFFGTAKRNDNYLLEDPRPIPFYGRGDEYCGNQWCDGYALLSRAEPNRQGSPPNVKGTIGPAYRGPTGNFEQ
jgi:hypothetical protein